MTTDTQTEEAAAPELSPLELAILEFERQWWKYPGAKESAVRAQFDMTIVRYSQLLNALIDRPEAMAYDAQVVNRLRRVRGARRAHRTLPSAARA